MCWRRGMRIGVIWRGLLTILLLHIRRCLGLGLILSLLMGMGFDETEVDEGNAWVVDGTAKNQHWLRLKDGASNGEVGRCSISFTPTVARKAAVLESVIDQWECSTNKGCGRCSRVFACINFTHTSHCSTSCASSWAWGSREEASALRFSSLQPGPCSCHGSPSPSQ
jgi:hypothetical protein